MTCIVISWISPFRAGSITLGIVELLVENGIDERQPIPKQARKVINLGVMRLMTYLWLA
jgi:hypothetical protein